MEIKFKVGDHIQVSPNSTIWEIMAIQNFKQLKLKCIKPMSGGRYKNDLSFTNLPHLFSLVKPKTHPHTNIFK